MIPLARLLLVALAFLLASCATTPTGDRPLVERDRIVRLQIFLDNRNYGPGKIDGTWGAFTDKARRRYLEVHGIPFDKNWDRRMGIDQVSPTYTTYTIDQTAAKQVGTVAYSPEEQAKLKSLPYGSLAEFVAERHHTTVSFLAQLNPGRTMGGLKVGDTLTVPNVSPFRVEDLKPRARVPRDAAHAGRRIKIDTGTRMLEVLQGDQLVATFPITPGSAELPAPAGDWRIVGISVLPWFRWDEGVLQRGERTDQFYMLPAGPNNPVGILWMGLSKPGIGIHGTNNPDTIGRSASHGCIRLSNWDAARMPSLVSEGTPVRID